MICHVRKILSETIQIRVLEFNEPFATCLVSSSVGKDLPGSEEETTGLPTPEFA